MSTAVYSLIGFAWMTTVVRCLVLVNDGYILVPHYTDMSCVCMMDVGWQVTCLQSNSRLYRYHQGIPILGTVDIMLMFPHHVLYRPRVTLLVWTSRFIPKWSFNIASSFREFRVCTYFKSRVEIRQSTIYKLRWVAWTMGQTNGRPRVWCSKHFFHTFIDSRHSKLFISIFIKL